jgi:hypothetical protein
MCHRISSNNHCAPCTIPNPKHHPKCNHNCNPNCQDEAILWHCDNVLDLRNNGKMLRKSIYWLKKLNEAMSNLTNCHKCCGKSKCQVSFIPDREKERTQRDNPPYNIGSLKTLASAPLYKPLKIKSNTKKSRTLHEKLPESQIVYVIN